MQMTTTTHIALLRGINVGGNKSAAMADLRDLLVKLGFDGVRSLLQSGNLVFHKWDRPFQAHQRPDRSKAPNARNGQKLEYHAEAGAVLSLMIRSALIT